MFDIVELELKNLTPEQKKDMYELLKLDQEFKNFNDGVLDKMWIDYFKAFPDHFINFQKKTENSLYNQALKQNNFKDLGYEDMVKNLTKRQKVEIINDIILLVENLKDEDGETKEDGNNQKQPFLIKKNTKPVWEYLKTEAANMGGIEFIERNKNSKYVMFLSNKSGERTRLGFLPTDDDLIFYTLNNKKLLPKILYLQEQYLNPHHHVNKWILKTIRLNF
ncbi:hypothetical protein [Mesomycoplasma ovipneumoniae]|uniref:hypothetical protein n=1 Tax=Mesomycoplasma ovipneumoniae TaxID=29562 RepID=UPI00083E7959|nr:hypothetical protein [Mesomycoplasma ovipneumoniae]